jgi:eukaryotic-like serine/threonine-protein kinase
MLRLMNADDRPSIGDTMAGRYRLTRLLRQDGLSTAYKATRLRSGQEVAIKVLPSLAAGREPPDSFVREVRAIARLRGRHVMSVFDTGISPEGRPYLVTEPHEGHCLRGELTRRAPLSVENAVRYVREACEGLAEAHRAGVVHRDVKPANLFLCTGPEGRPVVKVFNFDLAKVPGVADSHPKDGEGLTLLGTPYYLSPEQAKSPRSVDACSDIWSLGVVLYQLLSGKMPFQGEGTLGVVYAIATQAPPPLRAARPDVPEALVAVIERALCKELESRYQTVRKFADALAPFERGQFSSTLRPVAPGSRPWGAACGEAPRLSHLALFCCVRGCGLAPPCSCS